VVIRLTSEANPAVGGRQRGRARDDTRDPEILAAAMAVLAEFGYDRFTMDAVAAAAKAGKATIYRRWPSKAELVVDAIGCAGPVQHGEPPDTGSLRGDLMALSAGRPAKNDLLQNRIMTGLVSALPHHPDLAAIVQERLLAPRLAVLRRLFERAVARGEIPPERDLDMLVLVGPALVFHRLMVQTAPIDEDFLTRLTDQVIVPLALAPATRPDPKDGP
jgi:AcrR family transcriptional regulator